MENQSFASIQSSFSGQGQQRPPAATAAAAAGCKAASARDERARTVQERLERSRRVTRTLGELDQIAEDVKEDGTSIEEKRRQMNTIYSRRKRVRQRMRQAELEEQCESLVARHEALLHENRKLLTLSQLAFAQVAVVDPMYATTLTLSTQPAKVPSVQSSCFDASKAMCSTQALPSRHATNTLLGGQQCAYLTSQPLGAAISTYPSQRTSALQAIAQPQQWQPYLFVDPAIQLQLIQRQHPHELQTSLSQQQRQLMALQPLPALPSMPMPSLSLASPRPMKDNGRPPVPPPQSINPLRAHHDFAGRDDCTNTDRRGWTRWI